MMSKRSEGRPSVEHAESPETDDIVRVGLVADPDLPEHIARDLADDLPERFEDRRWTFEVEVDPVTAGKQNTREILQDARERLSRHDWDYAICITDLPVRQHSRPVLAEANVDQRVGVVSLPALGGIQPRRRTRQVITQLLDDLHTPATQHDSRQEKHGLKSGLTEVLAPIEREDVGSEEIDVRYRATKWRGRLRLLVGMVRTNRPWQLIFGLSSALAAAVATSAFALSSSTIWMIGDQLGVGRQILAAFLSIGLLVGWLIAAHHLWEKKHNVSAPDREQVALYNASTVLTLTIGVSCLYGGLLLINFGIALFLVPDSLLISTLGHPVGLTTYLTLAWGFTTMGVVAGALGSSLESDRAVRQAAYGYREEQRRGQQQERER